MCSVYIAKCVHRIYGYHCFYKFYIENSNNSIYFREYSYFSWNVGILHEILVLSTKYGQLLTVSIDSTGAKKLPSMYKANIDYSIELLLTNQCDAQRSCFIQQNVSIEYMDIIAFTSFTQKIHIFPYILENIPIF